MFTKDVYRTELSILIMSNYYMICVNFLTVKKKLKMFLKT